MNAHLQLFEYSMRQVTFEDIEDYCPSDPSYGAYVSVFSDILSSKTLPTLSSFEISETVELTLYGIAETADSPTRFRRFRTFTNAVAVAMCFSQKDSPNIFVAPVDFLTSLRNDASALNDTHLIELLGAIDALS